METGQAPRTYEDLLQALADLFEETELEESEEEVDAALRELGYDPDELVARMEAAIQHAIERSPLNWRNRTQALKEERAHIASFTSPRPATREDIRNRIMELLSTLGHTKTQLAYRNLDKASDDGLASLLAELEYLVTARNDQANHDES